MGVAVFAGMLGVTVFGLFLTPVFHVFMGRVAGFFARGSTLRPRPQVTMQPAEGQ
jgi:hypothetical protein